MVEVMFNECQVNTNVMKAYPNKITTLNGWRMTKQEDVLCIEGNNHRTWKNMHDMTAILGNSGVSKEMVNNKARSRALNNDVLDMDMRKTEIGIKENVNE